MSSLYPLVLLSPWLLESILDLPNDEKYTTRLVGKNFVKYNGPGQVNLKWTPLVRLFQFVRSDPALTAVVNDGGHRILAVFTDDAIKRYEMDNGQRITYKTTSAIFLVRRANLCFISPRTLFRMFPSVPGLVLKDETPVVILEISEVSIFSRNQASVSARFDNLPFVYGNKEYRHKFGSAEPKEEEDSDWSRDGD